MRMFAATTVFAVGLVSLPLAVYAELARTGGAAARFEVTSLRAVRPAIQKLIVDLRPDAEMVNATIMAINTEYNKIVQQITKEARDANTGK